MLSLQGLLVIIGSAARPNPGKEASQEPQSLHQDVKAADMWHLGYFD